MSLNCTLKMVKWQILYHTYFSTIKKCIVWSTKNYIIKFLFCLFKLSHNIIDFFFFWWTVLCNFLLLCNKLPKGCWLKNYTHLLFTFLRFRNLVYLYLFSRSYKSAVKVLAREGDLFEDSSRERSTQANVVIGRIFLFLQMYCSKDISS